MAQFGKADGFGEIGRKANADGTFAIGACGTGGKDNNRDGANRFVTLGGIHEIEAIHVGHVQIKDDELRLMLTGEGEGLGTIGGVEDVVMGGLQEAAEHFTAAEPVIGDENFCHNKNAGEGALPSALPHDLTIAVRMAA